MKFQKLWRGNLYFFVFWQHCDAFDKSCDHFTFLQFVCLFLLISGRNHFPHFLSRKLVSKSLRLFSPYFSDFTGVRDIYTWGCLHVLFVWSRFRSVLLASSVSRTLYNCAHGCSSLTTVQLTVNVMGIQFSCWLLELLFYFGSTLLFQHFKRMLLI